MLFASLRAPEFGSPEDLASRIDSLRLPSSLIELDEHYVADCPTGSCPSLVRWFDATASGDALRADIISRMKAAGIDVSENTANHWIFSGSDENYMYFVVLDTNMIATNRYAPTGTKAEILVLVLDQS